MIDRTQFPAAGNPLGWQQSFDALVAIECRETQAELRRAIEDVLSDAPRSGSTGTFTAEQVTLILSVACEPPEQSGRPIDRWTHRELADEVSGAVFRERTTMSASVAFGGGLGAGFFETVSQHALEMLIAV